MVIFKDRQSAGVLLAEKLHKYKARKDAIVLGIPRGGVVLAYEIAKILKLPLDVVITRKIGAPNQPELALGAVDPKGEVTWDEKLLKELGTMHPSFGGRREELGVNVQKQLEEIKRREMLYRHTRVQHKMRTGVQRTPTGLEAQDKVVIVVDDGIATGATILSAVKFLRSSGAKKIVVAAPVGAIDSIDKIASGVDELVVPYPQEIFGSVGSFYENFGEVTDQMVISLLK